MVVSAKYASRLHGSSVFAGLALPVVSERSLVDSKRLILHGMHEVSARSFNSLEIFEILSSFIDFV